MLGDVIVGVDGEAVKGQKDLFKALDDKRVGDRILIAIRREGKEQEVEITLAALDGPEPAVRR